jgi:hypothetical protein
MNEQEDAYQRIKRKYMMQTEQEDLRQRNKQSELERHIKFAVQDMPLTPVRAAKTEIKPSRDESPRDKSKSDLSALPPLTASMNNSLNESSKSGSHKKRKRSASSERK